MTNWSKKSQVYHARHNVGSSKRSVNDLANPPEPIHIPKHGLKNPEGIETWRPEQWELDSFDKRKHEAKVSGNIHLEPVDKRWLVYELSRLGRREKINSFNNFDDAYDEFLERTF